MHGGTGDADRLWPVVSRNPVITAVLRRLAALDVAPPDWYLVAGAVTQTVWNAQTGRPPTWGIKDYDVVYHDGADLSWDAEDVVIRRVAAATADLGVDVEVRNQARVHLWYERKFGVPCEPFASADEAIASYQATACCVGIRTAGNGDELVPSVFAPYGLDDIFELVLRPNPRLAPRWVWETKVAQWRRRWPELTVLPWPEESDRRPRSPRIDNELIE